MCAREDGHGLGTTTQIYGPIQRKGLQDVRIDFHNEGIRKLWHALALSLT